MSENSAQTVAHLVDTIDIHADKVADITNPELALKESLKKDLQVLWARKLEGRITDAEYNRYANAAKTIFERQNTSLSNIKREYTKERNNTLKDSNTLLENLSLNVSNIGKKARNIVTDGAVTLQQKLISEDTVQAYSEDEGNKLVSIKEFEKQIRTQPIEEINALALKNYLAYLQKKSPLTREILEQKLGSPERLLQLSILWGNTLQQGAHARKGGGVAEKMLTNAKVWLSGTSEKQIENGILKAVITDNIKRAGLEKDLFDKGEDKNKTREQLDKQLDEMNYEAIIKEFNEEFGKGKVTGEMVRKYFERKIAEGEKKVQDLKEQQKKAFGNKTVGEMFGGFPVQADPGLKDIMKKKPGTLTFDENKKLREASGMNGTGISGSLQLYFDTQDQIDNQSKKVRDMKHLTPPTAAETLANTRNNNTKTDEKTSKEKLKQVMKGEVEAGRSKEILQSKGKEGVYKETLTQIGYSHLNIGDICADKKTLKKVLLVLESKNLTATELYKDLKPHLGLEERRVDNYIMAKENITEEQLTEQKKGGRFADSFVDEIYKEDLKQKKTTEFTIAPELLAKEKGQNGDSFTETQNISEKLVQLTEGGKSVPLQNIGTDTCSVKKENGKYILSINGKEEKCSTQDDVENTINSYSFFYDVGLRAIAPTMDRFLMTILKTNPKCPNFDKQKGFSSEQQRVLFGVVDSLFSLKKEDKIASTGTDDLRSDFIGSLRMIDQKVGCDAELKKRGILTETGVFNDRALTEILRIKKTS